MRSASLKETVAVRDASLKRLEVVVAAAKADAVAVVNSSGSEREKVLLSLIHI